MMYRNRLLTMLLVVALVCGLVTPTRAAAADHPFGDIRGIAQEPYITALWQLNVVSGLTADQYSPNGAVTRAQMAALIVRAMGLTSQANDLTGPLEFSDVPANHWARGVISLASRMNIIKGDGGKFNPNDSVNYAQAATMLVRALGYENQVIGGYPSGYVIKANELGLLKNTSFELFASVNRAEAAVLLYNMIYYAPDAQRGLTLSQSYFKQMASLELSPLPAFAAPGQRLELKATVKDPVGKPIPDANISYTVASGSGRIDGNALILGDGGAVTVQATARDLSATTSVLGVSDLRIEPATFQASKGGTLQLKATAQAGSQRVDVTPSWRVTQGPATVDQNGLLAVTDYGAVTVQATLGNYTAVSTGQAVGKVTINTKPDYLVPGQSVTFTASATDSAGQPISVPIRWSADNGYMDANGALTNARGTQVTVTATAAGIRDQVTIPVLQSLQISPTPASVLTGKRVAFTATGVDATGKTYPVNPQWERNDPNVGIISGDGSFAGFASGSITITATLGTLQGHHQMRVAGAPAQLSLVAAKSSLPAATGASTTLAVKLLDSTGAVSPVDDQPVVFTLSDTGHGSLSRTLVLTRQGEATVTYTDGATAGTATVSASVPGTALTAQAVSLTTYSQLPTHIVLSATPNPLILGGNVGTVTATLEDANNYPAVTTQPVYVTLSANGGSGALIGSTITIPAGQSSGTLSFISNNTAGTVWIGGTAAYPVDPVTLRTTTAGPAAAVKIQPITGTTPVTGLTSLAVTVNVVDSAGVLLANDSTTQVQLSVTLPGATQATLYTATASRGTATFTIPAYAVGTANLVASLVGNSNAGTDSATAEFVPGVVSKLRLRVDPSSLTADGYSTVQVIAEVVDGDGTVLPSVNTTVTFRKLVEGSATTEVSSLTVPTVGGRAVLSLRSTRTAGTDIWFASAPGLDTQNLATIATTASSGDANSMRVAGVTNFSVNTAGTLTIQVTDLQGRVVTTDSGRTITATSNIPGVTITPSAVTQNGAATFAIQSVQSGSGVITFAANGLPTPILSVPVTFGTTGAAYSLFVSTAANLVRYGTPVTIWVRVMDSQGNLLTTDNGRVVNASVSGNAALSATQALTANGVASFTLTATNTGAVTLTFSAPGLAQPQQTLTITFTN